MGNKSLGEKVASGLIWSLGEKILGNSVNFIVSLVLARLILPKEYGIISIVVIFVNIMNVFVDSGFGNALIQKKDADDNDFHTVFIFQMILSVVLYLILYCIAPIIADFYNENLLISVVRVYGISIILGSIKNIQHAYVSKSMEFKLFFFSSLGGTIISGIVGISLAYMGCGVWSLVVQSLLDMLVDTIVLFFSISWKPKLFFSIEKFKNLYSYGWKLLMTNLISTGYNNMYGLVIGKIYETNNLALYNKGNSFPTLISNNVTGPIQSATFPALSLAQNDKERLKIMTRKTLLTTTYLLWPMLIGMFCIAESMISILLTEKWLGCVIFLQINSIALVFWPISSANGQLINAIGRSDISLKLDIIKKILGIIIFFISIPLGIVFMSIGRCLSSIIASYLDAAPNKNFINYSFCEQIWDLFPNICANIIMGVIVYSINFCQLNSSLTLFVQIVIGIITYFVLSVILKLEGYGTIKEYLFKIFNK